MPQARALAAGTPDQSSAQSLKTLSLEALGNLEVTSVSKDAEEVRRTPAAIHVITDEDIRRFGATTLPELLRLAPGVDVGRIDTTHWSVGVRGFGDQFSKSVLVLMDGRSIYTPLFGGVFWALQDFPLADVERIEVIRGPGATIWGSNAVNGVINIVTKSAAATQGPHASLTTGNVDTALGTLRYGGSNGRGLDFRVYAKAFSRAGQQHSEGPAFDTWKMSQGGGRLDWTRGSNQVSVFGDVYGGDVGQSVSLGSFSPPGQSLHYEPIDVSGGNLTAKWRRALGDRSHVQVQGYYDRTTFLGPQLGETRDTFDVDFTHHMSIGTRQRLTWGAGARISPSSVTQKVPTLDVTPHDHTQKTYGFFVQHEADLVPEKLTLTGGAKVEHYTYTGLEVQPAIRLMWTPTERQSFWTAVTRAVRTPSRLERDLTLNGFLTATPLPTFVRIVGNPDFVSERLIGYEGGYRSSFTANLYVDVAVFHNRHEDLESFGAASVVVETTPAPTHALLVFPYANGIRGTSDGIEIAPRWKPTSAWQLKGAYAFLRLALENIEGNTDTNAVTTYEGSSPRHQVMLQSQLDLGRGFEFDQSIRHVSALPAREVRAYTTADVRIGWRSAGGLQLAVIGRNLLESSHREFGHDPGPAVAVRRSWLLTATWTR